MDFSPTLSLSTSFHQPDTFSSYYHTRLEGSRHSSTSCIVTKQNQRDFSVNINKFWSQRFNIQPPPRSKRANILCGSSGRNSPKPNVPRIRLSTDSPTRNFSAPTLQETSSSSPDKTTVGKEKAGENEGDGESGNKGNQNRSPDDKPLFSARSLGRRIVRQLSSLPLAIGILFAIAGFSAVGTVIPQGDSVEEYMRNYPEENPILGVLTWRVILTLGLDHVYTAPWFIFLLSILAACLAACTSTRQLPMLKVARRWSFPTRANSVKGMEVSESLERARLVDLGVVLMSKGYEVFQKDGALYAFKGLAGRLAPIAVHASLLLIMAGGSYSALGGWHGSTMTPEGLDIFVPSALVGNSWLAHQSSNMNMYVHVNKFFIDYRPSGEVKQFYSDLSVFDLNEREIFRDTISVNHPLRSQGVTIYQTDWAISAIQIRLEGQDDIFNLPMAELSEPGSSVKLFGTYLPNSIQKEEGKTKGISLLAQDFQNVIIYDSEGQFVGVRRPGSKKPIDVDGTKIIVEELIGATGLELKVDRGVPYVYAGFGTLMLTSFISYLSHSQVYGFQEGSTLHVGGKTNRSKLTFKEEMEEIFDNLPEVIEKVKENVARV